MKIGFDVSQTGKSKAGCGYFADSLIRKLTEIDSENEYLLYPTFGNHYWDPAWASETFQVPHPNFRRVPGPRTFEASKLFWDHPPPDFEERIGNPHLIHSNNFFCPPHREGFRTVYTLYDLSFLVHPEWTTEENRAGCFQGVFNAALYADWIIAISHYSRKHFLEVFPHYPADRIVVVHPASRFSGPREISCPRELLHLHKEGFWLSAGVLEPRKNHRGLLRAYASLKRDLGKSLPLVLAGGRGWLMDDFEKTVESMNLRQDVILLGYVEDEALQWLYQNCFAFVYPSLFEGFGLPVLEAMSLGAPIISSEVTSIPEIVGPAGILVNPLNEKAIYEAMSNLAKDEDLRVDLKSAAIRQASKFSWNSAARAVLQAYREVLSWDRIFSS